jgi:hypothetical protein
MPSVYLFTAAYSATNGRVPVPGPVTDTFDDELVASASNGNGSAPEVQPDEVGSNSESDDPHGVAEINNRRYGMHRSRTSRTSMALTDYSVNPSTPSDQKRQQVRDIVPEDFLLPNGHPDVSKPLL